MNEINWSASPVTESLALTMDAILPTPVGRKKPQDSDNFLLVSYKEDFTELWSFHEESEAGLLKWILSGEDENRTIIIVWDATPSSYETTINIANYVTPYDWALACTWACLKRLNSNFNRHGIEKYLPHLRILIVDLCSQEYASSFAYNTFASVGHALPWIQVFQPIQSETTERMAMEIATDSHSEDVLALLRSAVPSGSLGMDTFYEDILNLKRVLSLKDAQADRDRFSILASLKNLWKSHLVKPGDRHTVGNLLGPMFLMQGLPKPLRKLAEKKVTRGFPLRNALKTLIDVVELSGVTNEDQSRVPTKGILAQLNKDVDVFSRLKNIRLLLVDDQFFLGFHHCLAYLLFGAKYDGGVEIEDSLDLKGKEWVYQSEGFGKLACTISPRIIFEALESLERIDNWRTPRALEMDYDVLLLDLRLWTTSNPSERTDFFVRLLSICDKLGVEQLLNAQNSLFDLAFERAFTRARELVQDIKLKEGVRITENDKTEELSQTRQFSELNELEALALLPLLISLCDPSFPILLFSSTHQRVIVEMLSHKANIITDFAKPILTGYGDEGSAAELVVDIQKAIEKAIKLHESRLIWLKIVERAKEITRKGKASFSCTGLESKLFTNNMPKPFTYEITTESLECLGDEYQNTILTGRFADSLMVPGNWVEGELRVRAQYPKGLFFLEDIPELLRTAIEERFPGWGQDGYFERVFPQLWDIPYFRGYFIKEVNSLSEMQASQFRQLVAALIDERNSDDWVLKNPRLLAPLRLEGMVPRTVPGILGSLCDSNANFSDLGFANKIDNWKKFIEVDSVSVIFSLITAFRNLRAHFNVRPEDSIYLRELSLWCWLWLLKGVVSVDEKLVRPGLMVGNVDGLSAYDYLEHGRTFVKASEITGRGLQSCLKILGKLYKEIKKGWLEITDDTLNQALEKIITSDPEYSPGSYQVTPSVRQDMGRAASSSPEVTDETNKVTLIRSGKGQIPKARLALTLNAEGVQQVIDCEIDQQGIKRAGVILKFTTGSQASSFLKKITTSHWLITSGEVLDAYAETHSSSPSAGQAEEVPVAPSGKGSVRVLKLTPKNTQNRSGTNN